MKTELTTILTEIDSDLGIQFNPDAKRMYDLTKKAGTFETLGTRAAVTWSAEFEKDADKGILKVFPTGIKSILLSTRIEYAGPDGKIVDEVLDVTLTSSDKLNFSIVLNPQDDLVDESIYSKLYVYPRDLRGYDSEDITVIF